MGKRPAKITRASVLRRECTSLPSLEPYRHRHPLRPSHLRRATCVSSQRCSSAQSSVLSLSTIADGVRCKSPELELPHPSSSKCEDSVSVVSFTHLFLSSSTSSLNEESFTITTRPPSRHGIAYEIVFSAPSVRSCYTPEPQLGPDHTYSFPRATAKGKLNTDVEFEDSDASESEEEAEQEHEEIEQKLNVALPAPKCKYGVFFTAAKPPLPPSALERIRKYRHYEI